MDELPDKIWISQMAEDGSLRGKIFRFVRPNVYNLIGGWKIGKVIPTGSAYLIFTESLHSSISLCLKVWKRGLNDGIYDTTTNERCLDYDVEGLNFNRYFAPGVYLGMARVENIGDIYIDVNIFSHVVREQLLSEKEHVLVMNRLLDEQRLDAWLEKGLLDTEEMLKSLAYEIVRMHQVISISSRHEMGSVASLEKKLYANIDLISQVTWMQDKQEYNRRIAYSLWRAFEVNKERFEMRRLAGHIKRCHGDLKASNLWQPAQTSPRAKLVALDCIDFNPDYCHIDTLSDVAMLAIDLENSFARRLGCREGQALVSYFLANYLEMAEEDGEQALPLLEYYMAEKAIIRAYTSEKHDHKENEVVEKYVELAEIHARRAARELVPM